MASARSGFWFRMIIHTATAMIDATVGSMRPADLFFSGFTFAFPST